MEPSDSPLSPSFWDYINLLVFRPILAVSFVLFLISLGWYLAWKLVLAHVPLVQEIFGLRKRPVKPKPPNRRRLSRFYSNISADKQTSLWGYSGLKKRCPFYLVWSCSLISWADSRNWRMRCKKEMEAWEIMNFFSLAKMLVK